MERTIFIHVPKTGGKTMIGILKNIYNTKIRGDKSEYSNMRGVTFNRYNLQKFNYSKRLDINSSCIIGHFPMSKYIHLKKRGWKCITWLRDPVERIISFYSQRRDAGFMFDMPDFMDIDILEWSRRLTGTYNLYLDCDLELLDFVGFTETYNESLKEMEKILRCEFDIYDKRNVTKVKADITEGEREIIRHHQSEDINIYNELYDKWSTRSRIKQ